MWSPIADFRSGFALYLSTIVLLNFSLLRAVFRLSCRFVMPLSFDFGEASLPSVRSLMTFRGGDWVSLAVVESTTMILLGAKCFVGKVVDLAGGKDSTTGKESECLASWSGESSPKPA